MKSSRRFIGISAIAALALALWTACASVSTSTSEPTPMRAAATVVQPTSIVIQPSPTAVPQPTDIPVSQTVATPIPSSPIPSSIPSPLSPASSSPTLTPPSPDYWQSISPIPTASQRAIEIFVQGQAMGRDPHRFSKVGDCQNITTYFLAHFEDPSLYRLGPYADLQATIDWYKGSFGRESLAVKGGLNVAAVISPLRADPQQCEKGETPLACEYRLNNPSIAIISMEEAWAGEPEKYGKYMREVIEYTISQGIVPVIATKADNLEGDHQINTIIAALAWEYQIPLWDFWAAVQPLKAHGLITDGFHLTHRNNYFFDVKLSRQSGWTQRNLTALQTLDALRRTLTP